MCTYLTFCKLIAIRTTSLGTTCMCAVHVCAWRHKIDHDCISIFFTYSYMHTLPAGAIYVRTSWSKFSHSLHSIVQSCWQLAAPRGGKHKQQHLQGLEAHVCKNIDSGIAYCIATPSDLRTPANPSLEYCNQIHSTSSVPKFASMQSAKRLMARWVRPVQHAEQRAVFHLSAFLILLQFSYLLSPGVFILLSYILYKGVHRHLGSPIS